MTEYTSPTLIGVRSEEVNPPPVSTSCRGCTSSMWFTTPDPLTPAGETGKVTVNCYCRAMHSMTWTEDRPTMPNSCDGQAIGQAQLQMKSRQGQGGEDY